MYDRGFSVGDTHSVLPGIQFWALKETSLRNSANMSAFQLFILQSHPSLLTLAANINPAPSAVAKPVPS